MVLSLGGCVFVSGAYDPATWQLNTVGIITGLLSGLAFAGYSLMGKMSARRGINPWTALLYSFLIAGILLVMFNFLEDWLPAGIASTDFLWLGNAWTGWLVLISLAWLPTIGGYGLYTVSLGYLPVSVANLIATLEPAMTAAWAFLFLGERMTSLQIVGSAMIIAGVVLLRVSNPEAQATETPAAGIAAD